MAGSAASSHGAPHRRAAAAGDGYVGLAVHHAARVAQAAHGGEIIASESTVASLDCDSFAAHRSRRLRSAGHSMCDTSVPDRCTGPRRRIPATERAALEADGDQGCARGRLRPPAGRNRGTARAGRPGGGGAGRNRDGSARPDRVHPPRHRDRGHPHAADEDRRGNSRSGHDQEPAPSDERAAPLVARRGRKRAAVVRQRGLGAGLPAQGTRRRRRRVRRRGASGCGRGNGDRRLDRGPACKPACGRNTPHESCRPSLPTLR